MFENNCERENQQNGESFNHPFRIDVYFPKMNNLKKKLSNEGKKFCRQILVLC